MHCIYFLVIRFCRSWVNQAGATAPCYWVPANSPLNQRDKWHVFGVNGLQELNLNEPISHLNFFEADAFSQWAGTRLPTEFEWEHANQRLTM